MSYRQIFDEAIGHAPPSGVDLDQVVRRQRRAARVRPALATLAAAAVLAAGGGVAIQLTGEDGGPVQVPGDQRAGFPEYLDGTRVIAAEAASMSDSLSLTFTPGTTDLLLFTRCESDQVGDVPVVLEADLTASVAPHTTTVDWFCTVAEPGAEDDDGLALQDADGWGGFWNGLAAGEPTTIDISLVEARAMFGGGEPGIPDGTFAVAVAERVPWEEYEFPPRPATLPPLPEAQSGDIELRADPADPNRRVAASLVWDATWCEAGVLPLELVSQTPGSLQVLIDTSQVAYQTWWDYEQAGLSFSLDPACGGPDSVSAGDQVTIAVQPEHMTGDWAARINRAGG